MPLPPLFKAYGCIGNIPEKMYAALENALEAAIADDDSPLLCRERDMARISLEGRYFPEEDVLDAIRRHLTPEVTGRLDVLDMESWRLARHLFEKGSCTSRRASLNDILAYSGF